MREAQDLTKALIENLQDWRMDASSFNADLVALFSELVNNAAEHGMSEQGAHVHVRYMPPRKGHAFDVVVVDSGQGIRASLARNPELPKPETDAEAVGLAVQELVSGTGIPTRGTGLWMTATEMRKPGRRMSIHSGSSLMTMYGQRSRNPRNRRATRHSGQTHNTVLTPWRGPANYVL